MSGSRLIIDRIEKLYALASGGATLEEAKAATLMAEKLMKKYNIKDSEVNKHRYTKGEKAGKTTPPPRQKQRANDSANHWSRRDSGPFGSWDNWGFGSSWRETDSQKERDSQHEDPFKKHRHEYWQNTFAPIMVKADLVKSSDKAYLLNVYLDESKYPWSKLPRVVVAIWIPKSQVTTNFGTTWLLNEEILRKNLDSNKDWLRKNHPVFKGIWDIQFHFKSVI